MEGRDPDLVTYRVREPCSPASLTPASPPPDIRETKEKVAETRSFSLFPKQELNEVLICLLQAHPWVKPSLSGQLSRGQRGWGLATYPLEMMTAYGEQAPNPGSQGIESWVGEKDGDTDNCYLRSPASALNHHPWAPPCSQQQQQTDNSTKLFGLKSISNQMTKERKQINGSLYYAPDIVLNGLHRISNRICKTKMWNAWKLDFQKLIFF